MRLRFSREAQQNPEAHITRIKQSQDKQIFVQT